MGSYAIMGSFWPCQLATAMQQHVPQPHLDAGPGARQDVWRAVGECSGGSAYLLGQTPPGAQQPHSWQTEASLPLHSGSSGGSPHQTPHLSAFTTLISGHCLPEYQQGMTWGQLGRLLLLPPLCMTANGDCVSKQQMHLWCQVVAPGFVYHVALMQLAMLCTASGSSPAGVAAQAVQHMPPSHGAEGGVCQQGIPV